MYGDSVQFKSTQMSCMLGFIKSVWKKTCYSDIPNPERQKTTSEEKHTLFEDVWGTSQGLFNGDLLSSSKGFLSPNLPFLAWKRIAKEPRGCNKNRSFLGWIKLFFPLSGRCFLLPLQRWQWKSHGWTLPMFMAIYQNLMEISYWYKKKIREVWGSQHFPTKWLKNDPFEKKYLIGNCLSQKSHLEVKNSLSITLWLSFECSSAWMLAPNHQPTLLGMKGLGA